MVLTRLASKKNEKELGTEKVYNLMRSTFCMQKPSFNVYVVLLIVLGGVTITSVLAQSVTITSYPYILTDGTNQRFIIASTGNVGIGNSGPNPPGLLNVRQLVDTNLGGMVFQNSAATGSMRFWMDSGNVGYLTASGGTNMISIYPGTVGFPNGNVGIGTSAPTQKLDVRGNVILTGNMTATPAKQFKISTTNGKDICIGAC